MHHYPWNIGDYHVHTADLTHMEDLAYRRLLDFYYLHEKPIPADVTRASKKIRMAEYVDDVRSVLEEFFRPSAEGWVHGRAEEEIERMRTRIEASEERDEHEESRQQRHREKRSAMFAALREVGVYLPWNAKTGQLEAAMLANNLEPVTAPVTPPVTLDFTRESGTCDATCDGTCDTGDKPATACGDAPATAIPTPTPTPTPISKSYLSIASAPHGEAPIADLLGVFPGMGGGNRLPNCPHAEILALWREELPDLPQHLVSQWKGTRAAHLRARWRETAAEKGWTSEAEGLAYFRKFFRWLKGSPFLMGKVTGRNGRAFELELAWLVNPTNWAKTHEGKYHG